MLGGPKQVVADVPTLRCAIQARQWGPLNSIIFISPITFLIFTDGAPMTNTVRLVTANYHMPRSLMEFGAAMPGVKLVPYPVAADTLRMLSWENAKRLQGEYVKYLASTLRISVAGALHA